jgi:hypothetical protein
MSGTPAKKNGTRRATVRCSCGELVQLSKWKDRRETACPACGNTGLFHIRTESQPTRWTSRSKVGDPDRGNRLLIAVWSATGVLVTISIVAVLLHAEWKRQSRIADANHRITNAVLAAQEWVGKQTVDGHRQIEDALVAALQDPDATEKDAGLSVLTELKQHHEELIRKAEIRKAEEEANAIWNAARRQLSNNNVAEALGLMRTYLDSPHAIDKSAAESLMAQTELAMSDEKTQQILLSMADDAFSRVQSSGEIADGRVTDPILIAVRRETTRRNLDIAIQQRAVRQIAEEKRRAEEKMAEAIRQQQEDRRNAEAENARLAEESRRKADFDKKIEQVRNPPEKLFKDVVNFPEEYLNSSFKLSAVWLWGGFDRDKDAEVFCVDVSSDDGKLSSSSRVYGDDLVFVLSETFGRGLDLVFEDDKKTATNLCCTIFQFGKTPVARIYRIETLNRIGQVRDVYEDESALTAMVGEKSISFKKDIAPWMVSICLRCHSGTTPNIPFVFTSFKELMRGGPTGNTIVPGNPDDSYIVDLVLRQDPIKMPGGIAQLKLSQAKSLEKWIREGAVYDGDNPNMPMADLIQSGQ